MNARAPILALKDVRLADGPRMLFDGVDLGSEPGVRACLVHESFSARQGVEDDDMNVLCLGGLVVGRALAWDLVQIYLAARFAGAERYRRRLAKVALLESNSRPR